MTRSDILFEEMIINELLEKDTLTGSDKSRIKKGVNEFKEILDKLWDYMINMHNESMKRDKDGIPYKMCTAVRNDIASKFNEKSRYDIKNG